MTVREYFENRRDLRGRALLSNDCWIDQWAGSYRLNGPTGTVLVVSDEDIETATRRFDDLKRAEPKPPFIKPVRPRFGRKLDPTRRFVGDESDNSTVRAPGQVEALTMRNLRTSRIPSVILQRTRPLMTQCLTSSHG